MKVRIPRKINSDRDYIRVGNCDKCRAKGTSIVVHHPPKGRSVAICHFCSKDMWLAVGESNKDNWLKGGNVTKGGRSSGNRENKNKR
jgi:hypothetical protein